MPGNLSSCFDRTIRKSTLTHHNRVPFGVENDFIAAKDSLRFGQDHRGRRGREEGLPRIGFDKSSYKSDHSFGVASKYRKNTLLLGAGESFARSSAWRPIAIA